VSTKNKYTAYLQKLVNSLVIGMIFNEDKLHRFIKLFKFWRNGLPHYNF